MATKTDNSAIQAIFHIRMGTIKTQILEVRSVAFGDTTQPTVILNHPVCLNLTGVILFVTNDKEKGTPNTNI